MICNVVQSCFLTSSNIPPENEILALTKPGRGQAAWLGGANDKVVFEARLTSPMRDTEEDQCSGNQRGQCG